MRPAKRMIQPACTALRDARRSVPRRLGVLLALLLAGVAWGLPARPAQQPATQPIPLEYAVKATYLYKFAPFVTWPPTEFASPDAPFLICVAGEDPFGSYLEDAVAGRGLGTHPFQVRRLDAQAPASGCQILFVGRLPAQDAAEALDAVDGKPVLTVVDSATPHAGGVVRFVIDHGRVRFQIDAAAAARNRIAISSKLLSLATTVKGAP